jgi:glyoxylase-like metal-dependent hydrolase (beta-lactamase superfamily II)
VILRRETLGDVERFTLGRRVLGLAPVTAHCYRLGSVLVDAGPPNRAQDLVDQLEGPITDVLLTHAHEDHVGAAARLADQGARVWAPEPLLEHLAEPPELPRYRRDSWGIPATVEARAMGGAVETPEGRFDVVATPGHSPHHVALHQRERGWVFAGDAYLGPRSSLRFDERLGEELASLERLVALEPERLFPGHGSVAEEPVDELETTRRWYRQQVREAHRLRAEGHSVSAIRRRMFGLEGFMRWYTGAEFAKTNLVRELLRLEPGSVASETTS